MYHKKILESINWRNFLNDVMKLEGEEISFVENLISQNPEHLYLEYLKKTDRRNGNLAAALYPLIRDNMAYILAPLSLEINEVDWAITYKYVHPSDVTILHMHKKPQLLKDVSLDSLHTVLADDKIIENPKMLQYLETELILRKITLGKNAPAEFENFIVTPATDTLNKLFSILKHRAPSELKAIIAMYNLPAVETIENTENNNPRPLLNLRPGSLGVLNRDAYTIHSRPTFVSDEDREYMEMDDHQEEPHAAEVTTAENTLPIATISFQHFLNAHFGILYRSEGNILYALMYRVSSQVITVVHLTAHDLHYFNSKLGLRSTMAGLYTIVPISDVRSSRYRVAGYSIISDRFFSEQQKKNASNYARKGKFTRSGAGLKISSPDKLSEADHSIDPAF